MGPTVRAATESDADVVAEILEEAATWLKRRGIPLWDARHVGIEHVRADLQRHTIGLAEVEGVGVGVVRFQLEDEEFWPDVPKGSSAFIHRLAVRRQYAGGETSWALMDWAVEQTRSAGRRWLRLDCADRPKLRAVYERYAFQFHSERQVGEFYVARYELDLADPDAIVSHGPVHLRLVETVPGDTERGLVPYHHYVIMDATGNHVGHINLRLGDTRHVMMCAGHVGFGVHPEHRGRRFAFHACRALAPVIRRHYDTVILTANPENLASRRTIEQLGAVYLDEVEVPEDDPAFANGARRKIRYEWKP